jgi:hypothetical protein
MVIDWIVAQFLNRSHCGKQIKDDYSQGWPFGSPENIKRALDCGLVKRAKATADPSVR